MSIILCKPTDTSFYYMYTYQILQQTPMRFNLAHSEYGQFSMKVTRENNFNTKTTKYLLQVYTEDHFQQKRKESLY